MAIEPRLDIIGAALADPSRSRILCELMDGRAFTNKELACAAAVSPQTASAHLKQLETAGLTSSLRSGRHIYHRIASANVAQMLEGLATLSPVDHLNRPSQIAKDTRCARSCYNHIAGRLGVLVKQRLVALNVLALDHEAIKSGLRYNVFLEDIGIKPPLVTSGKSPAKLCLDWTERRHHISGPLATAIMQKSLDENWLHRRTGSRALTITEDGFAALERWFGLTKETIDGSGSNEPSCPTVLPTQVITTE
jgi:DNA-binding transcriptional ArsR family regulator